MARRGPEMIAAFTLAPLAGAAAIFFASVVWSFAFLSHENGATPLAIIGGGAMLAGVGIILCFFYTLVVGGAIAAYMYFSKKTPPALAVVGAGVIIGCAPVVFTLLEGHLASPGWQDLADELHMPVIALAASVAAAGTFWRIGVRPLPAKAENMSN